MIFIGVALEIFATVSGTVGKQLLRYSKISEVEGKATLISRASLVVGLILNILGGPVLEVLAYGQAPQTLLAPLGGLDVLWNMLLVPHTLGEHPTRTQVFGCIVLVFGTALTAIGGPHTEKTYTLHSVRDMLLTRDALIYIVVETAIIAAALLWMSKRKTGDSRRGLVLGIVAGGIGGNLFCMKAAASLIQGTCQDTWPEVYRLWINPLSISIVCSAALIGLVSAFLLAQAMREYEATMMVATYEGSLVVSGCASGVAILGELDVVSPQRQALYALGVVLVVAGIERAQGQAPVLSPYATPVKRLTSLSSTGHQDWGTPLLKSSL